MKKNGVDTSDAAPIISGSEIGSRDSLGRFTNFKNGGRKVGSINKRRQTALDIFQKYDFDPLEKKILLCRRLENKLHSNHFQDIHEKIEYLKLYAETLRDLLQYGYQRLKAVEHYGVIEVVQRLQELAGRDDAELVALIEEAEQLIRAMPA